MTFNRSVRRIPFAPMFVAVGAACGAAVLLSTNPHGVPRVVAPLLAVALVVAVGAGKYLKRLAISDPVEGSGRDSPTPTQKPAPSPPPQWASDDYWYPAAATRDRTGTRLGGSRRHGAVESMCVEVDNSTNAPARARQALQSWFVTVKCPVPSSDDALLIVSELVTNVVVHTTSDSVVTAAFDNHRFRIEVHDHDPRGPIVAPRVAVAGRGLHVVDALCDLWGWEPTAFGKRVWTEMLF